MYLLDTNTCIYALTGRASSVVDRLKQCVPSEIEIPSIVAAELFLGAAKSVRKKQTYDVVCRFLKPYTVATFGFEEAKVYAEIRGGLEQKGYPIRPNDLIIAATTISRGGTLITNNLREFERVSGLRLANWKEEA